MSRGGRGEMKGCDDVCMKGSAINMVNNDGLRDISLLEPHKKTTKALTMFVCIT